MKIAQYTEIKRVKEHTPKLNMRMDTVQCIK